MLPDADEGRALGQITDCQGHVRGTAVYVVVAIACAGLLLFCEEGTVRPGR